MNPPLSKLPFYHVIAYLTLALLAGCNGGSSNGTAFNGVAASGAPLVGVVVSATDSDGNVTNSEVTDLNGKYSLTVKGNGPYVLTVPFNDIDGSPAVLSSLFVPHTNSSQANINPLTSLITSRVLGQILTEAPSGGLVKDNERTQAQIVQAEKEISTLFQPVYIALGIPEGQTNDPIGSTVYQANPSDPLDNLFTLARFMVHTGQVSIGTGANRFVLTVPATGPLPGGIPAASVASLAALNAGESRTPIKNLIVVIGENHTFDAVFGAYQAPQGQSVKNLISQGIINVDGTAGPNFGMATQNQAIVQTTYSINPTRSVAYATLPRPLQTGELTLPDFEFLGGTPDLHFPSNLANGPFQLTKYVNYRGVTRWNPLGEVTGDPVHRFFQMWQQTGGTNQQLDMHAWVAVTTGQGGDTAGVSPDNPAQGAELMAFLNMNTGDAPYWKTLAQQYAMSDNYHQSIHGGTGINFFSIATGDVPYFNVNGAPAMPDANQIENPNPMAGTPNFYEQDGYEGGSYVNCSDNTQPGVAPILALLSNLNVVSKCDSGKYYLVNNYGLGYDMHGNPQPIGPNNYTLPPQTVRTIAEALADKGVSWKWYTGARELADVTEDLNQFHLPDTPQYRAFAQSKQYNAIGDPLVASKNIMTSPSLKAGLAGLTTFYNDIQNNTLPAVSFVVPKNLNSGHPGFSVQEKYETFIQDLIAKVQANPTLWEQTAIIITTDEGGGYFDTGPIQVQDFFGDGSRIPMIVVSPFARTNYIDHTYHDHASILKFIERNWKLDPLSSRSRDNHPNPVTTFANLYQPINTTPSIGDLMTMFEF